MLREEGQPGGREQFDHLVDPTGEIKHAGLSPEQAAGREAVEAAVTEGLALLAVNSDGTYSAERELGLRKSMMGQLEAFAINTSEITSDQAPQIAALSHMLSGRLRSGFQAFPDQGEIRASLEELEADAKDAFMAIKTDIYGSPDVAFTELRGDLGNIKGSVTHDAKADLNIGSGVAIINLGNEDYFPSSLAARQTPEGHFEAILPAGVVEIPPNKPMIAGRGRDGLTSRYISEDHVALYDTGAGHLAIEDTSKNGTSYRVVKYPNVAEFTQEQAQANQEGRAKRARHRLNELD